MREKETLKTPGSKSERVTFITADSLRRMQGKEALILQGCAAPYEEWLDGINDILTREGILQDGCRFETVSVFTHEGLTNLLFPLEDVQINIGRLAMWRLQTHADFGGTWLSDYVPNRLGGFLQGGQAAAEAETESEEDYIPPRQKPDCPLIGEDGNIFHLMGLAGRTLHRNGQAAQAKEMQQRITTEPGVDYYRALSIIAEYVNITSKDEMREPDSNMEEVHGPCQTM